MSFHHITNLKGPKGDRGPAGVQGPAGAGSGFPIGGAIGGTHIDAYTTGGVYTELGVNVTTANGWPDGLRGGSILVVYNIGGLAVQTIYPLAKDRTGTWQRQGDSTGWSPWQRAATVSAIIAKSGPGRPDQPTTTGRTITGSEPVGTTYSSTDGPQGAWQWAKRPTGWTVTVGDTGWIDLSTQLDGYESGLIHIRREDSTAWLRVTDLVVEAQTSSWAMFTRLIPEWARIDTSTGFSYSPAAPYLGTLQANGPFRIDRAGSLVIYGAGSGERVTGMMSWPTTAAWPTTLQAAV